MTMDAWRLVEEAREELAEAGGFREIVAEAWQAQALAEAVGGHLAAHGGIGVQAAAFALADAGGRGCGALHPPGARDGRARSVRLTAMRDPAATLTALRRLLDEVGVALVGMACAAEDEAGYWQCVDAVDAVDETKDRLAEVVRLLEAAVPGEPPGEPVGEVRA
jgi:Family of unknown function (DUF6099)